jgi:hypothetical protein
MDPGVAIFVVDLPMRNSDLLSDTLFDAALKAVDLESQQRAKRFYRKEDAWSVCMITDVHIRHSHAPHTGCLIGRILPLNTVRRLMDDRQCQVAIQTIATGKPFLVRHL